MGDGNANKKTRWNVQDHQQIVNGNPSSKERIDRVIIKIQIQCDKCQR